MSKMKFKTESRKYKTWCMQQGYKSGDPVTLLWYYNRKGKAIKTKTGSYEIIIKGKKYRPEDIIEYFKNNKSNGGK